MANFKFSDESIVNLLPKLRRASILLMNTNDNMGFIQIQISEFLVLWAKLVLTVISGHLGVGGVGPNSDWQLWYMGIVFSNLDWYGWCVVCPNVARKIYLFLGLLWPGYVSQSIFFFLSSMFLSQVNHIHIMIIFKAG